MQAASSQKLKDLQAVISKMSLPVCCVSVLPEFGVRWKEVSRAVRNCRLPMMSSSVARVLCRHAARSMPEDEIVDIIARLRLKLVVNQERKWHVIALSEPIDEHLSAGQLISSLPKRLHTAVKMARGGRDARPEIQTCMIGDLVYLSLQMVSNRTAGSVLYVCTPPGQPVALVSSLSSGRLHAVVKALGYKSYEDAKLFGKDIHALLRIHDQANNENVDHLADLPEYKPMPVITKSTNSMIIDYTNKAYDEDYVDRILGPDPPLLNDLNITMTKSFFDPTKLRKKISVNIQLKSEDIAKTLKCWAMKGAIPATSELFHIFRKVKSNVIATDLNDDKDDDE